MAKTKACVMGITAKEDPDNAGVWLFHVNGRDWKWDSRTRGINLLIRTNGMNYIGLLCVAKINDGVWFAFGYNTGYEYGWRALSAAEQTARNERDETKDAK